MRFRFNPENELRDLDRNGRKSTVARRFEQSVVAAFGRRMQLIRAMRDERELYQFRGLHFERLERNAEEHSIRLNDQWRLIVRFREDDGGRYMWIDKIEDYH